MKCIGIIGAMEQEVARIKEKMQDVQIPAFTLPIPERTTTTFFPSKVPS